ncbi:hypothetical protein XBLMG947_2731 [Xanthomonas bromi]|uniref:Uncharacterized protein n=1 Tax=Xanthomonas bromi TaxID=56449 RepID=A0A1C3NNI8_9XANT|nr:hypothetical protein XBLMG947_2731 [Xanthomonas bromi]
MVLLRPVIRSPPGVGIGHSGFVVRLLARLSMRVATSGVVNPSMKIGWPH